MHGDCFEKMWDIDNFSIDLVLADPPYGTTDCAWDSVLPVHDMWKHLKRVVKLNGAIVLTASQPFTTTLISSNLEMFKYCWIWDKQAPVGFLNAKKMPMGVHEEVCVFYENPPVYNPQGVKEIAPKKCKSLPSRSKSKGVYKNVKSKDYVLTQTNFPSTILKIKRDKNSKVHSTQKPIKLMEYFIKTYTNEGDTVLDFTMGSGTTGIACKKLNRNFIGIEIDDFYFNLAKTRIKRTLSLENYKNRRAIFRKDLKTI